jgi:response regulator RpfG family c-di-GMP phosphodiesterase
MNVKSDRKAGPDFSPNARMPALSPAAQAAVILNVNGARNVRASRTRALRKAGYRVIESADCREVHQLGLQTKPDVIVINGLSSPEDLRLCAQLKANPTTRETPLIALCSLHTKSHAHFATSCFPEPVTPKALLSIIGLVQRLQAVEQRMVKVATSNQLTLIKSNTTPHDLLSPLSTISSLAAWIRSEYGHRLGAGGENYLELLDQSIDQMRAAVLRVFAVSVSGGGIDNEPARIHGHRAC